MRTVPVTGAAGSPSARYQWFANSTGSFTTNARTWVVIIGAGFVVGAITGVQAEITVTNGGSQIDAWYFVPMDTKAGGGSADSKTMGLFSLPRRMLVPANSAVVFNGLISQLSLVQCRSLEDALAIL